MAIYIPIVTELKSDGIDKAKKEFKSLEGVSAKAGYAVKKAAVPAAAAVAGLAAAAFDATKAAVEDAAAQAELARTLKQATNATDASIAATEDWISAQGQALGVTDDELRPALAKLVRQTGSVSKAQKALSLGMDIAAATGKPLAAVTTSIEKALGGQTNALAKLDPALKGLIKEGMTAEEAMAALNDKFGGAAQDAAGTTAGQFKRASLAFAETKESIGAALIPVLEKMLPYLTKFAQWASENPTLIAAVAAGIGGLALAILAVNAAMALNPITLIVIGIGALIAALAVAYKKFEGFKNIVDAVFSGMKWWITNITIPAFQLLFTIVKTIFNGIASAWNNTFGKLSFKIPSWVPGVGGKGFEVPNIPMLAQGGLVMSPTLALIGEAGPEAVVPLDRMNDFGGGGGNVTIHVNGGDPNAVVDALRKYYRQNGPLPVGVSY
jgi:molybdenum-dependent DNA-binding transcriptional regulator ModE